MRSAADNRLLLATRSDDKLREIRDILADSCGATLVSLTEAGIEPSAEEDDIEAFDTFVANAHAKAAYFLQRTGLPTLADDSGLQVDALHGAPGVLSRRFAARPDLAGRAQDEANNAHLLDALADVPDPGRGARYACAAVLHLTDGRRFVGLGTCPGSILRAPRGAHGFGYDPLFRDPLSGRSFAEIDPADKNRRSHRARAFRALAANLPADVA